MSYIRNMELEIHRGYNFEGDSYEWIPAVFSYLHYYDKDIMFIFDIYQDYDKKFIIHLN